MMGSQNEYREITNLTHIPHDPSSDSSSSSSLASSLSDVSSVPDLNEHLEQHLSTSNSDAIIDLTVIPDSDDEIDDEHQPVETFNVVQNVTSLRKTLPQRLAKFTLRKQPRGSRLKRKNPPFVEDLHFTCFSRTSRRHFFQLDRDAKETYIGTSVNPFTGYGLFAAESIKAGDFITLYYGNRLSQQESDAREKAGYPSSYFLELPKGVVIDSLGTLKGAGMANHSCRPNSRLRHGYLHGKERAPYGYLQAISDIAIGDEITCDYGYILHLSDEDIEALLTSGKYAPCRCLQPNCRRVFFPLK